MTEHTIHQVLNEEQETKTIRKIYQLTSGAYTILEEASNKFWSSKKVKVWQITKILKARFNLIKTLTYHQMISPDNASSNVHCPLCHTAPDTVKHRLGPCTHPAIHGMVCKRHGHAVWSIKNALVDALPANPTVYCDAETYELYPIAVGGTRKFPAWILPVDKQTSKPDIVIIPGLGNELYHGYERAHYVVHLIEVTYTTDLDLPKAVAYKEVKHAEITLN